MRQVTRDYTSKKGVRYELYEIVNNKERLVGTFDSMAMAEDMMEDGKTYEIVNKRTL